MMFGVIGDESSTTNRLSDFVIWHKIMHNAYIQGLFKMATLLSLLNILI